jgi:hypothetical protein
MKQYEAVIQTMEKLGGIATLGQLNQEVFKIKDCVWKTKTPFASIRRIVQTNDNIYKIKPGLYGLRSYQKLNEARGIVQETERNKNSKEITDFNHYYYQGLAVKIGNLKRFKTYIPNQDKNRLFLNEKLGDIKTLSEIPKFSYESFVQRSSTVDVIWFNERMMPHSFIEVENSGEFQNSLVKFGDLQDFNSRMIIVADKIAKSQFEKQLSFSAFQKISKRVEFLDYESLTKQYERAVEEVQFSILL